VIQIKEDILDEGELSEEERIEQALDDEEIDAEEAGFLRGYHDEDED
jgi:hypothetical protein|tara:strand:+ start:4729 stop:4869 length:141 start_codon:yes stop_codon:yes gene_type:complete